jgi:hypothetical protein
MGLDMYLSRYTTKGYNLETLKAVEAYFSLEEYKKSHPGYECTLRNWRGVDEQLVTPQAIADLSPLYEDKYFYWDSERKYPHKQLSDAVGYWRKANHIHNWFVENVQCGVDNCGSYIVSRDQLVQLRDACQYVLDIAKTTNGAVEVGVQYSQNGVAEVITEPAEIIINAEECAEILPTRGGFFFGGIHYDEYYLNGIKTTVQIIDNVLKTTDFDKQIIVYSASW